MRKSRPTSLVLLAAATLVMACDSSPKSEAVPSKPKAPEAAPANPVEVAPSAALTGAEAPAGHASQAEAPAPETQLRAALLGLNKKKDEVAEVADQTEPEEATRPAKVKRRRAVSNPNRGAVEAARSDLGAVAIGLSDGEFQSTVNEWRAIKGCIAQNAGHMQNRSGALQLAFDIAADGSVADCKVVDMSNAVAQAIAPCVQRKARRLRFPSFDGDSTTKVAKFVF